MKVLPAVRRELLEARGRLGGDAAAYAAQFRPELEAYARGCAERARLAAAAIAEILPEPESGTDSDDAATVSTDREGDLDGAGDGDDAGGDAGGDASEARALAIWPASSPASLLGPVLRPVPAAPPKRRILSFCLFGTKAIYCVGAVQNARLAKELFPEWACVFYCAGDVPAETLSALTAAGAEARLVSARCRGRQLALLRFLPCGDAGVDAVCARDADSRLNPRDAAAVASWLDGGRRFHILHERGHDTDAILGGMWGARSLDGKQPPLPDVYRKMAAFVNTASSAAYGDDMAFLAEHVKPLCTPANVAHHSGASGFFLKGLPFRPFPDTPYRGFVGQPINCPHACGYEHFLKTGCPHVCASDLVNPEISARLRHQPDILSGVAAFLGDAAAPPPPPIAAVDVKPPPLPKSHRRSSALF